jgi:RNA polymerase sigma factor (sigma-70 family)
MAARCRSPPSPFDFDCQKIERGKDNDLSSHKALLAHRGGREARRLNITPRFAIEDDDLGLLARFTAFVRSVAGYARLEYLRKLEYRKHEAPLDGVPADTLAYEDMPPTAKGDFDFAEEEHSRAFADLSPLRREILKLIFAEGLTAQEAADKLGCSVDNVYLHKHRALKKMRDRLLDGGGSRGE